MPAFIDLTGRRFGCWKVLERADQEGRRVMWIVRCDCGTERAVDGSRLRSGGSRSCGCTKRRSCPESYETRRKRQRSNEESWKQRNPELLRVGARRSRLAKFGLTIEDWDRLYEEQGGRCRLCGVEQCPTGRRFAVDHDHATGRVRGLLCYGCNSIIGWIENLASRRSGVAQLVTEYLGYEI